MPELQSIQIGRPIDIPKRRKLLPPNAPLIQQPSGGSEDRFGPPLNAAKHLRKLYACADQHIAAIFGRTKHHRRTRTERLMGRLEIRGIKTRTIGADDHAAPRLTNSALKSARHPIAEVACALLRQDDRMPACNRLEERMRCIGCAGEFHLANGGSDRRFDRMLHHGRMQGSSPRCSQARNESRLRGPCDRRLRKNDDARHSTRLVE